MPACLVLLDSRRRNCVALLLDTTEASALRIMLAIVVVLLVVFWVGFLVSWAAQPSTSASGTAAGLRFALLHHGNANDPFWQVWLECFHHASHTFNIPTQITSFHDRLDDAPTLLLGVCTSVDGVVVTVPFRKSSVLYEQMDSAINSCIDRGAVILIANTDTYENKRAVAYVGSNNYEIGWECARYLLAFAAYALVGTQPSVQPSSRSRPEQPDLFRTGCTPWAPAGDRPP